MTFSRYEEILYFIEEYGVYNRRMFSEEDSCYSFNEEMRDMVYSRIRNMLLSEVPDSERPSEDNDD